MKKVFVVIACAALMLACGGNATKGGECKGHKTECSGECHHGECAGEHRHHGECGDCGGEKADGNCGDCTEGHQHGECGDCKH